MILWFLLGFKQNGKLLSVKNTSRSTLLCQFYRHRSIISWHAKFSEVYIASTLLHDKCTQRRHTLP